jgi:hypothetical protein
MQPGHLYETAECGPASARDPPAYTGFVTFVEVYQWVEYYENDSRICFLAGYVQVLAAA